jgi:hypothetical protein
MLITLNQTKNNRLIQVDNLIMLKEKGKESFYKIDNQTVAYKYNNNEIINLLDNPEGKNTHKIHCKKTRFSTDYTCTYLNQVSTMNKLNDLQYNVKSASEHKNIILLYFLDRITDITTKYFDKTTKKTCIRLKELTGHPITVEYAVPIINGTDLYSIKFDSCLKIRLNEHNLFPDYVVVNTDQKYQVHKYDKLICQAKVINQDKHGCRYGHVSVDFDYYVGEPLCKSIIFELLNKKHDRNLKQPSNFTTLITLAILTFILFNVIKLINKKINTYRNRKLKHECIKNGKLCGICLEDMKSPKILMPCRHTFCGFCAPKLENCPMCRKHIDELQDIYF